MKLETRPITEQERHALNEYTKEREVQFWGGKYRISPVLVGTVFGDGKKLMFLEPLATRPEYYVIMFDSAFDGKNIYEVLDDDLEFLYDVIGDEFGDCYDQEDDNPDWPALNTTCGCSWGVMADIGSKICNVT